MEDWERPLAVTDIETTSLEPEDGEIIEIGLVMVRQETLEVIHEWAALVMPEHIDTAQREALVVNGYNEQDWRDAMSLEAAMRMYIHFTKDAIFAAFNASFDWDFIRRALRRFDIANQMYYLKVCLLSIPWDRLRKARLVSYRLDALATYVGLAEEPRPHRALVGARIALEVYRRLTIQRD